MSKKLVNFGTAAAMALTALVPAAPAFAHDGPYEEDGYYRDRGYGDGYYDRRGYRGSRYDDRGYYRDQSYRYRGQRCGKGTTGLIIGAVAGGLLGRSIVGYRGDRTAGAIVGAGVGALAGRAIDKSDDRGRC
ncbi:glycine zipper 2TM domain-containing protein [Chakrabartia godavariana]|jgi:hypothetical protein|nr:glycine zipper 2TM domain-containing protein [Chakrabartia godavariana]